MCAFTIGADDHPVGPQEVFDCGSFAQELRIADAVARRDGSREGFWGLYGADEGIEWIADRPITDDDPLLEYPEFAENAVVEVSTRDVGLAPR